MKTTGHLGRAFHDWLEWLEYAECVMLTGKKAKPRSMTINERLFQCGTDAEFTKMINETVPVDAELAHIVRSSVKYKMEAQTFLDLYRLYKDELEYLAETRPIHLPHDWCTLVLEGVHGKDGDTILVSLQETTSRNHEDYPNLGVEAGEPWYCANVCFHRSSGVELSEDGKQHPEFTLSHCPVEFHFTKGDLWQETTWLNAIAGGVQPTPDGVEACDLIRKAILIWLQTFHLAGVLRSKAVGLPPPPKAFRPKKFRKKRQHPNFEHFVVELPMDKREPQHTGESHASSRKRLHQVRGFFRHYKTGKVTWVKPHWRGDEHLGVVRSDYDMVVEG